ncbi:hypothetical protein [Alicyclobacillus fastidiosus]|uniref:hypothetical protein n=1 Tax=Alicyclobacillus fastidiosus TaxID=392011 RepID=UPI0023B7B985|nr:hypothetical protein [Alicyclobacillus fastidiosus]WEH08395.1 hypothetical protein PYS47_17090 [Alicyclobacillus fastidiosus]
MKIATGIISLVLMVVMAIQTMGVGLGSAILSDKHSGAGTGVLLILLYLIGGAFVFAKPIVSVCPFVMAFIIGISVGPHATFKDLTF